MKAASARSVLALFVLTISLTARAQAPEPPTTPGGAQPPPPGPVADPAPAPDVQPVPIAEPPPSEAPPSEAPPSEAPPSEGPPSEAPPGEAPPGEAPPGKAAPPQPAAPADSAPEEVVVTARRRAEPAQRVPMSVTKLDRAQLESSAIRELTELEALAPNTLIDWIGVSPGAAAITIRGIGFRDVEKSFDPAVGVVLDGVYLGTSTTALLNNFDFESVEILRGPQGTLFGRNTTAGVINVRRTRPTGELGLKVGVTVGAYGRNDYRALGNFPLKKGVLAGKLSFYSLNQRGMLHNLTLDENVPDAHYMAGTAELLYTPSRTTSVLLKYERARDREKTIPLQNASDETDLICFGPRTGYTTFSVPQCRDPRLGKFEVESGFKNQMRLDLDAVTLEYSRALTPDYKLISVAGFRGHDEDAFQDFDGTAEDFFSTRRTQRYDQLSEELRLEAEPHDRVRLVGGLFYFYGHYDMDGTTFFLFDQPILQAATGPLPLGTVRVQDAGQDTHSAALFASADYEVIDELRLSAGGRYTYEHKRFYNDWGFSNHLDSETARMTEAADDEPRIEAARDWARFTPRAGLDYTLRDPLLPAGQQAMLYVTYAQGWKSGGFNARADPASKVSFDPERVDQYEAGLKTSWLEGLVTLNGAIFYIDYRDKQEELILAAGNGGQQTLTRNAASATIEGLELEAASTPLRALRGPGKGLKVWANLGLLRARYDEFVADLSGPNALGELHTRNYAGLELRDAPRWQFALGAGCPFELFGIGRLSGYAQYRMRSAMRTAFTTDYDDPFTSALESDERPDRRGIMPAYGQLDATLTFDLYEFMGGSWRFSVFGRNITNNTPRAVYLDVSNLFAFQAYNPPGQWGAELGATY
jgi:iron complex outermembrane receptor protein